MGDPTEKCYTVIIWVKLNAMLVCNIYIYIKKHVLVSNGSWLKGFTLPHYFRNLLEFSGIYNKVTLGSKMENNLPTTVMGVE